MDSLCFLMKSQLFGEFPNLSNMNSDFTSTNQNYLEYYLYQEHIQDCSSRNTEQCILFPFM